VLERIAPDSELTLPSTFSRARRFLLRAGLQVTKPKRLVVCQVEDKPLQIESLIRAIPDFPIPGVLFRDITPLLGDPAGFKAMIDLFGDRFGGEKIDQVVAMEARGYILGAPLAYRLGAGFVPVRKPGKLPGAKFREEYALEYGTNALEIHTDALQPGQRVLVVDDVLATGGTAAATARLLKQLDAEVVGFAFLIDLSFLDGRKVLEELGHQVTALITY
jgi:adenine phosphoribosyltransferase